MPGLGETGVAALKAAETAGLRFACLEPAARPVLDARDRVLDYLGAVATRKRPAHGRVLFLDRQGGLRADEAQTKGLSDRPPDHARELVRRAIEVGATALILVNNHPGGEPVPTDADVQTATEARAAAAVFGIKLRDHLIMGHGRPASMPCESLS